MATVRLSLLLIALATASAAADDYPPAGFARESETFKDNQFATTEIATSPRKHFKIEQWTKSAADGDEYQTWLVSPVDPTQHTRLPEIAGSDHVGFASEFSISPEEAWLFRSQKRAHGVGGAYLYAHADGLRYVPAKTARLDLLVERLFARAVGVKLGDDAEGGIVEYGAWSGKRLIVTLRGNDIAGYDVVDWHCTVDLATGGVSVTPAQGAANKRTFKRHARDRE
jgi:hypothetical protein